MRRILQRTVMLLRAAVIPALGMAALAQAQVTTPVTTYHYNTSRTGVNSSETILNTTNVQTNFGKLFSLPVDAEIYAQPLYMPNVTVPGQGVHNVVYVATMNNSVYAFDADTGGKALWKVNFGTPMPDSVCCADRDILVQIGILSTPVIDPNAGILYLVAETYESGVTAFTLHAISITTGADMETPVVIQGSVAGTASDGTGKVVSFVPIDHWQRPALLLANGQIYVAFGSHQDTEPYHGWLFSYNATTLAQTGIFCVTPNGPEGGIWQGGVGITADTNGYVYVETGNGLFDANTGGADYGDSLLKLSGNGLTVADYFTPSTQANDDAEDWDLGSAGALLIPGTTLVAAGGKDGKFYIANTANMGKYNAATDQIFQEWQATYAYAGNIGGFWAGNYLFFNNAMYAFGERDYLKVWPFNGTNFAETPSAESTFIVPAGFANDPAMTISSNGTQAGTGIVWAAFSSDGIADGSLQPGVLYAFDASNVANVLWNSNSDSSRDSSGAWAKWNPPIVANGKVYLASFDNLVNVYGLLSSSTTPTNPAVGSLTGSSTSATTTASLTAAGSADWIHWGDAAVNRKANVTAEISNYAVVENGKVNTYNNDPRGLTWSDGTPTPSATADTNGVYVVGVQGGFSFTAPADTTTRTLTVYVGGWDSGGTLTASLSDGSAANFVATTTAVNGQYDETYTLTYNAISAGQTLTVSWIMSSGAANGNVTLNGAALSVGGTGASGPAIAATGGTPQSAAAGTAFAAPLQATVTSATGTPQSGVTVTFTAPSTGASATFGGAAFATAVTNGNGVAISPTPTANATAGSYLVSATATGVSTAATFALTNTAPQSQTITFGPIAAQSVGGSLTLGATASSGLAVTYTTTTPTVCTVVGSLASFIGVGSCSITASQAGNAAYSPAASVTQSVSVSAAAVASFSLSATSGSVSVVQGQSGAVGVAVSPVNGFTGSVNFSASGLPTGVTANFVPASSTSSTTVTFTATSGAATGLTSVTITGTSASITASTTVALTVVAAGTGSGSGTTPVPLGTVDNLDAIAATGKTVSGIGSDGYAYASALLPGTITYAGASFSLGAADTLNAVTSKTIALPTGSFTSLSLLGTGLYGSQLNQKFIVTYTDGSSTTFTQSLSDWGASQSFTGEKVVATTSYRITPSGGTQNGPWNLYGYTFTLNAAKVVKSLTLPSNTDVVILGAELTSNASTSTGGPSLTGTQTNSAATVNLTAVGTTDWIQWGDATTNRKANVTPELSTYSVVGGGAVNTYNDDPRGLSWSDGTPTATATGDTNGVYVSGLQTGFIFTAPAGTTPQTLTVYVGGFASGGTLTASLSDGSAANFVATTAAAAGQYDEAFTLTYAAASAGQTLTVSWVMSSGTGNVTVNAAALSSGATSAPQSQTITFGPIAAQSVGGSLTLGATASSGLAVTYTTTTPTVCTVVGSLASFIGVGSCSITASQAGNAAYSPAASVTQSVSVSAAAVASFSLSATSGSVSVVQGQSGAVGVAVSPVNGFTGSVNFSASGLPTGVTANFVPASSTSSTTVTFTATSGAATGLTSVTITGTSASITASTTVALTVVAAGTGSGSGTTPVPLGTVDNLDAIAATGKTVSGIGSDGYAYASALLPGTITYAGASFSLGAADTLNAVTSKTIALPTGSFTSLSLLGTGLYGSQLNQKFIVTYTDGSSTTFTQSLSDWGASQSFTGEKVVATTSYRITPSGGTQNGPWNLYGYTFTLNAAKVVKSLTLPSNTDVVILGAELTSNASTSTGGPSLTGTQTNSAATVNLTAVGTTDWIQWGDATTNRKANVTPELSTYSVVGGGAVNTYNDDPRGLSWSDGTPTATATGDTNGVYVSGLQTGFIFTAPAGTTPQTLTVYVGGFASGGTLTASLSDGSAANFVATTAAAAGQYDEAFTLTYAAASAGQTLTVSWVMSSGTGNVTVNAAALSSGATSAPQSQTITFGPIAAQSVGGSLTLGATASSGLAVTYTTTTPTVCTVVGSLASFIGVGSCSITASQAGNAAYSPAASVTQSVSVSAAAVASFSLSATSGSVSVVQGQSGAVGVAVSPVNGFTGSVNFSASGLPTGVTANFVPASSTSSTTVTFTATSGAATGLTSVTITGTSASITASTTVALTVVAAGTGSGSGTTPVPLGTVDNLDAIAATGKTVSGIGSDGYAYASALLPGTITYAGASFSLGAADTLNAVTSKTIALPTGSFTSLSLLGTGLYGSQLNQKFIVTYTDGSSTTFTQSLSDWGASQSFTGEKVVATTSYRITPSGGTQNGPWNLYGYTFTLNAAKVVKSLTLPSNTDVVILGAELTSNASTSTGGPSLTGTQTNSAATVNLTAVGTTDWIQWGDATTNRKANVTPELSTYSVVGGGAVNTYNDDPRGLSWSDGTPTATATGDTNGVYVSGLQTGFIFTAPAGTTPQTLTVYVGGFASGGTLTASLSDGSAANFVATTAAAAGQYDEAFTLTYAAASAGQTLTVSWVMSSGTGNVTVNAAALSSAGTGSGSGTTPVPLGTVDNLDAIAATGRTVSGIGSDGYAYASALLPGTITYAGASFSLGAADTLNAVTSKTIALPTGSFASLSLLGTGIYGGQLNQKFIVTYTDGSSTTFTQSLSDWQTSQSFAGETVVATTSYRITPSGATQTGTWNLYGYSFTLNAAKVVKSLTLPSNTDVVIFGAELIQ